MSFWLNLLGYIPRFSFEDSSKCFLAVKGAENNLIYVMFFLRNIRQWTYKDFIGAIIRTSPVPMTIGEFEALHYLEWKTRKKIILKTLPLILILLLVNLPLKENVPTLAISIFGWLYCLYFVHSTNRISNLYYEKRKAISHYN